MNKYQGLINQINRSMTARGKKPDLKKLTRDGMKTLLGQRTTQKREPSGILS